MMEKPNTFCYNFIRKISFVIEKRFTEISMPCRFCWISEFFIWTTNDLELLKIFFSKASKISHYLLLKPWKMSSAILRNHNFWKICSTFKWILNKFCYKIKKMIFFFQKRLLLNISVQFILFLMLNWKNMHSLFFFLSKNL